MQLASQQSLEQDIALHRPYTDLWYQRSVRGQSEDHQSIEQYLALHRPSDGPLTGHRTMKREDITEVKFFRTGFSLLSEISKVAHNSRLVLYDC